MLGAAMIAVLVVVGGLSWYAYTFATNQVRTELSAQKVYFPEKSSVGFDATEFSDIQKFAGQPVDNRPKARAYANGFIGRHLEKVACEKTYSEVSAMAMKDPTNTKLQGQIATLFQGETLRGLLPGDGCAYWTFGMIAIYAALVAFADAIIVTALVVAGIMHIKRAR